ncbi:hypothetical protein [Catellatospora aurea]
MRQYLSADPGRTVVAAPVTGPAQVLDALAACGLPAVVKLASGTGSGSFSVVRDPAGAAAAVAWVLGTVHPVAWWRNSSTAPN